MTKEMWLSRSAVKNSLVSESQCDFQSIADSHKDFLEHESFFESSKLGEEVDGLMVLSRIIFNVSS